MRIISETTIKDFWRTRRGDAAEAERAFRDWIRIARGGLWKDFADMRRRAFRSADTVGDCIVFDVGHNRYRLIARLRFHKGIIYILKIMDHAEYDLGRWATECGCHSPAPSPKAKAKKDGKSTEKGGSS